MCKTFYILFPFFVKLNTWVRTKTLISTIEEMFAGGVHLFKKILKLVSIFPIKTNNVSRKKRTN